MIDWPKVLTAIRASCSATSHVLNDDRDQMLALAAWFQSQDIDALKAGTIMPVMLGLMLGARANHELDLLEAQDLVANCIAINAVCELRRKTNART